MGLYPCPSCGQKISDLSTKCGHCGIEFLLEEREKTRPKKREPLDNAQKVVIALVVGFVLFAWAYAPSKPKHPPKTEASETQATNQLTQEAEKEAKLAAQCAADASCTFSKYDGRNQAEVLCKKEVEQRAQPDFKSVNLLSQDFTHFGWVDGKAGKAVKIAGDNIRVQNHLGLFVRHLYGCEVNLENQQVQFVVLAPGHL